MNNPIQSLWIGDRLSTLERLSIQSFLDRGHAYHLYVYRDLPDVPAGALLKDANDIFPESEIFQYRERKTYAAFANIFRYKLLHQRGGIWADTDIIALRPLDLAQEHAFASEIIHWRDMAVPRTVVTNCFLKCPRGSPAMAQALTEAMARDRTTLRWGEIGPRLVGEIVEAQQLQKFVLPPAAICPVAYENWRDLIDPQPPALPAESYAVHFWNEMWRMADQDKNADYPAGSLYERFKRRHLHRTNTASYAASGHADELPGGTAG